MDTKVLSKISYGLCIVSSKKENKFNGQVANALFQVTSTPPTIAVSISKQNLTHEYIENSGAFTVSILDKNTPLQFIGLFGFKSGRNVDKFKDINFKVSSAGNPVALDNAIGYLEAVVIDKLEVGTHTIFVGKLIDAAIIRDGEPMTYSFYHDVKKGTTPVNAPTYQGSQAKRSDKNTAKYVCTVCGYVYDPEKGDPDGGIKPGTGFEDLPKNWVCPICGASKDKFELQA